jgi:DNA-directed RNA polymerase subunit A"
MSENEMTWRDRASELPPRFENYGPEKKEELRELYRDMQYQPGEAIGMVASQSLAEPATQLTMETYHQAGAAQVSLTKGLPRLEEIVDARRNPKTPTMIVRLKNDYQNEEEAKRVARKIREVTVGDLVKSETVDIMQLTVEYELNENLLADYEVEPEDVADAVRDAGQAQVDVDENTLEFEHGDEDANLRDLTDLKLDAEESRIRGIKGIEQVVVTEVDGEWELRTAGTSLRKTMRIDEVDETRTISNDLFEVESVIGIEGLRQRIIEETKATLEEQGIGIDDRHIMLLADMMTKDGELNGCTRYGIVGEKDSVLARSAYEETKKHLSQASLHGEVDDLEGVVENIVLGQSVPVGTGKVDLKPNFGAEE